MKKIYHSKRSHKRDMKRQIEKQMKNRKVIKANEAFNSIKSSLMDLGWEYESEFGNAVELDDKWEIKFSPVIILTNKIFNVKIIPHNDGVEISRLEVHGLFQRNGYGGKFLKSLLNYLLQHRIENIYLIPMPAGIPGERSFLALNPEQLDQFYFKRGFRKMAENDYWKLDIDLFQKYLCNENPDIKILNKDYVSNELKYNLNIDIKSFIWQRMSSNNNSNRA